MISLTREGNYLRIKCPNVISVSSFRTLSICTTNRWFKILRMSVGGYELIEMADQKNVAYVVSKYISTVLELNNFRLVEVGEETVIAGVCVIEGKNHSNILEGVPNSRSLENTVVENFRKKITMSHNFYTYVYLFIPNVTGIAKKMCIFEA